jgi:hypothetical protein
MIGVRVRIGGPSPTVIPIAQPAIKSGLTAAYSNAGLSPIFVRTVQKGR